MKKFINIPGYTSLLVILFMTLFTIGCQKSPINGDLDGQWQVMEVTPEPEEIDIDTRIYYCFSLHTTQLSFYEGGPWTSGNILKFTDSELVLEFPYAKSEQSVTRLKQYGIYSNPVTFTIETLNKKTLVLRDGDVVVTMRKF